MNTSPYDEQDLSLSDLVIRRVNPKEHVVPDHNSGGQRLSSKLFSPLRGGVSIDIPRLMLNDDIEPRQYVTNPTFLGSVQLSMGDIRATQLWVGYEPLPENPYHGEIWKSPQGPNFSRKQKRELLKACMWFVELDGVQIA